MIRAVVVVLSLGTALAGANACGETATDDRRATAPIWKGENDISTPERNAVVYLENAGGDACSGFLLTSTIAITAVHCGIGLGSQISVGIGNPKTTFDAAGEIRAIRNVTAASNMIDSSNFPCSDCIATRAKDVALVRFWPPITMDASPRRPTLQAPPTDALGRATFHGGMVGYGQGCPLGPDVHPCLVEDGGPDDFEIQPVRQIAVRQNMEAIRVDVGGGYAAWVVTSDKAHTATEPWALKGDSGGPLFQLVNPPSLEAKDVFGVLSAGGWQDYWPCPEWICGEEDNYNIYADITAPSTRAWIESTMFTWGATQARWPGEIDYDRTAFGTPGCDVASDPSCDLGCNAALDKDCDLILDAKDNCPNDYNPDQANGDNDPWGDACDSCPAQTDAGENCNSDAEILHWNGGRVPLREDHVVGDPEAPFASPSPTQLQNWTRYPGDRCDSKGCMDLAKQTKALSPPGYGAPPPTDDCVLKAPAYGGTCAYTANNELGRDGKVMSAMMPYTAHTAYRFCKCVGGKATEIERIASCFNPAAGDCPWEWQGVTGSANAFAMTMDPALQQIPNDPSGTTVFGTLSDGFSPNKKFWSFMKWDFGQDHDTIYPGTGITFPLTETTRPLVAMDGLIWSNVRQSVEHTLLDRNLLSHFEPIDLRVNKEVVGASGVPKSYQSYACLGGGCVQGTFAAWLWVINPPSLGPKVFVKTAQSDAEITAKVDTAALDIFDLSSGSPDIELVTAAELASVIHAHGIAPDPRIAAIVDAPSLTFLGSVTNHADGGTLTGAPAESRCRVAQWPYGTVVWTLSATEGKLFFMKGGSGVVAEAFAYEIATDTWSLVSMMLSESWPGTPLALAYNWRDQALYALQEIPEGGTVRLLRISKDGSVAELASARTTGTPEAFLSVDFEGRAVVSVKAASSYKIAHVQAVALHGQTPGTLDLFHTGSGRLLAAPFADDRTLNIVTDAVPPYVAVPIGDLTIPTTERFQWLFD